MNRTALHLVALLALGAMIVPVCSGRAYAQVAVIAHRQVPVDTLAQHELLDFYSGDRREWSDRTPVVVLDLKEKGGIRDLFYAYLGKPVSRMKSIWLRNKLSGEGDPPLTLEDEAAVLEKVQQTPGAIGFISSDQVDTTVKILAIIRSDTS
jgi:ABC-type phosphate transport system substrate-binding protein